MAQTAGNGVWGCGRPVETAGHPCELRVRSVLRDPTSRPIARTEGAVRLESGVSPSPRAAVARRVRHGRVPGDRAAERRLVTGGMAADPGSRLDGASRQRSLPIATDSADTNKPSQTRSLFPLSTVDATAVPASDLRQSAARRSSRPHTADSERGAQDRAAGGRRTASTTDRSSATVSVARLDVLEIARRFRVGSLVRVGTHTPVFRRHSHKPVREHLLRPFPARSLPRPLEPTATAPGPTMWPREKEPRDSRPSLRA